MAGTVLILGSAPDAVSAREYDRKNFVAIVAVNNAWRIRNDWTHLIHAGDFPTDRMPTEISSEQQVITHETYVPANNAFGGIVYAGGTMAFTAAYWALNILRPDLMVFCGCDMVYAHIGQTHFYGKGSADPLRKDPTLQTLEAKSNRIMAIAAKHGCLCANASQIMKSRLTFPRIDLEDKPFNATDYRKRTFATLQGNANIPVIEHAMALESEKQQFVVSGDYWNYRKTINEETLLEIDTIWLNAFSKQIHRHAIQSN